MVGINNENRPISLSASLQNDEVVVKASSRHEIVDHLAFDRELPSRFHVL